MSYDKNVYYSPEASGLVKIDELNDPSYGCYEYHTFILLQDTKTKRLFYAEDSGCSCPTPFEGYHFTSADNTNMDEVKTTNFGVFETSVNNFNCSMEYRQSILKQAADLLAENEPKDE